MEWFRSLIIRTPDPNAVIQVDSNSYTDCVIHHRDESNSMVLYTPATNQKSNAGKANGKYEIVLQRPCNETVSRAFSLCRLDSLEAAELRFLRYEGKVPILVAITQDYSISMIQRICDVLSTHPSWTIAHLAVELNLPDAFICPEVLTLISHEDPIEGVSPLQLAVQNQNIKIIQILLNSGAPVDHFNFKNESTLHYAAKTSKKIIQMLCEKSTGTLNSQNAEGYTPLHVACKLDKLECVSALLEAGADVNISTEYTANNVREPGLVGDSIQQFPKLLHEEDIKYGGTPLHWARSRQVIEALVQRKCDINCLNFDKRTALHVMVLRGRLDCAVSLLSLGADHSLRDKDGLTALRIAVNACDVNLVKALIVFNADINEIDKEGKTLRHNVTCGSTNGDSVLWVLHSVGAKRCSPLIRGCSVGCSAVDVYNGVPPPAPLAPCARDTLNLLLDDASIPSASNKGRLLSLDGGGIRGLIIIVILMELEKAVKRPLIHCFDWVAGTSTGGILAIALASGKSLQECLCLYFKMKDQIFVGIRPYSSEAFEAILKESFGEETTMSAITEPKLMITATLMDRQPVDLHLFRNYPSPSAVLGLPHEGPWNTPEPPPLQKLWIAARATGAAPSYFSSFKEYVDGGLISNNPTLDALTEIHEYNTAVRAVGRPEDAVPLSLVVSIGTGSVPLTQNKEDINIRLGLDNLWRATRVISGLTTLIQTLVDQATQADGRVVDRARAWCSMLRVPYFRFSPQLSQNIALDENSNEKLINMMWETMAYMHAKMPELKNLVKVLQNDRNFQENFLM